MIEVTEKDYQFLVFIKKEQFLEEALKLYLINNSVFDYEKLSDKSLGQLINLCVNYLEKDIINELKAIKYKRNIFIHRAFLETINEMNDSSRTELIQKELEKISNEIDLIFNKIINISKK